MFRKLTYSKCDDIVNGAELNLILHNKIRAAAKQWTTRSHFGN